MREKAFFASCVVVVALTYGAAVGLLTFGLVEAFGGM